MQHLVFYFDSPTDAAASVWAKTLGFLQRAGLLRDRYSMSFPGRTTKEKRDEPLYVNGQEALNILQARRPSAFSLSCDFGDVSQHFSFLPNVKTTRFKLFSTGGRGSELMPANMAPLLESLAQAHRLAIAGTEDSEYTAWQNCADPQTYVSRYGPIGGFRIVRPFPPPHDNVERLDTSTNPGRVGKHRTGPAFVRADLWLGPAFWEYAPCRKEEVAAQSWLKLRQTEHFLHINAYPEPFTRPDGEQGEIQRRLWRLLFHSDCHWPPVAGCTGVAR